MKIIRWNPQKKSTLPRYIPIDYIGNYFFILCHSVGII
jgi:hypothetical protein